MPTTSVDIERLDQLRPDMRRKMIDLIRDQVPQLKCPSCGGVLGTHKVKELLPHRELICKNSSCKEKVDVDLSEISELIKTIERS